MDTNLGEDVVCLRGVGGCHFNFNEDEVVMKAAASVSKSQVQVAEPSLAAVVASFMWHIAVSYKRGVTRIKSDLHDLG